MGSGFAELAEKGDFGLAVGGEGQDGDDANFDRSKVTINKFWFIGELEDHPIVGSQTDVDKMEGEPVYLLSHLTIRDIFPVVCEGDPVTVLAYEFIKLLSECLIDPVALFSISSYEGFWEWYKSF